MKNERLSAWTAILLSLALLLTGCSGNSSKKTSSTVNTSAGALSDSNSSDGTGSSSNSSSTASNLTSTSLSALSVKLDSEDYYFNWKAQSYKTINLSSGASTITKSGIYEIKGTLKDGSLTVNVDKTTDKGIVYLILNGVNISSTTSAPIYIQNAKKVVILLENGTQNTVYQGSSVKVNQNSEPSSAIFSKSDLTITGEGTLNVTSDYNDGITSKDKLKITSGTITVKAKSDGIVGKDLLAVEKGSLTITAGKDGMRSTNEQDAGMGNIIIKSGTFNITAANDGIQAYALLQIDGGTFNITAGGGYTGVTKSGDQGGMGGRPGQTTATTKTETDSKKALKSSKSLIISSGTINISCPDDAIHSSGDITISGGTITLQSGDDGIHSETDLKISSGTVTIKNSYEGLEGKNITISNGKINITSSDDGFNVNNDSGLLTISGGEVNVNAQGDGVDSNGSIKMTGGTVYVSGPTNDGNGALDYNGTFTITGGKLVAAGSSGMAQVPESGSQCSVLMYFSNTQSAGTAVTIKDSSGNVVVTYTPSKQYNSVAFSAAGLKTGSTYTLYSGNTKVVQFKPTSTVTYLNESGITTNQGHFPGGGGDFGGGPGGR